MFYQYNKDDIKQSLTLEQVSEVVIALGALPPNVRGDMFITDTICHNLPGEGSEKLYYYDNTKLFKCYTDCGDYFDIFQLVQKAMLLQKNLEWELPQCVAWVAEMFGIAGEISTFDSLGLSEDWALIKRQNNLQEKIDKFVVNDGNNRELKVYDDTILTRLNTVMVNSWSKEGITKDTMNRYGIKYYPKDEKIVIPHWDIDSNLIGIRGRTLIHQEGEWFGKYMPIRMNGQMYNHPLSFALYGLNFNKSNIQAAKVAIIFEGEKSVMKYDSIFGSGNNISVASCGSSISTHQYKLLCDLGVEEIVIAFDRQFKELGDKEFQNHTRSLQSLANKFNNYVKVSCMFDKEKKLDYKSSPIDHGKEVFLDLFQNRIFL